MMANGNGALHTLERNRFYYGKPMDVRHWQIEQAYGIGARELLTRLGLGVGVLCGLGVTLAADGSLVIDAGVAVDGEGREIVVPAPVSIATPDQPTDCMGVADGAPITDGTVTIVLCYRECLTEPAKAIACGCDTVERCEYGIVQERFCVRVDRDPPPGFSFPCDRIYPAPPPAGFDRRHAIFDLLGGACTPASDACVPLATVTFAPGAAPVVDDFTCRRSLYSNQTLFELILCLAGRVDQCCGDAHTPPPDPPRVTQVWPPDKFVLSSSVPDRDRFIKQPHIEVTFERAMNAAELAAPDPWLRVFAFRQVQGELQGRRVGLTLGPTVTTATGGVVAAYIFDQLFKKNELRTARVLVELRADDGGGRLLVDTGSPSELLDGEHHGTALTQAQLDDVWTNLALGAPAAAVDATIWDALVNGSPPAFPSGNGVEGGQLDLAFAFQAPATQPQLKAVWPPSASYLHPLSADADEKRWLALLRKDRRIELTFDDTLDQAALAALNVDDWLGLWWIPNIGQGVAKRLPLHPHGVVPSTLGIGGATVTLGFDATIPFADFQPTEPNHLVIVVRGDKASVDADFASPAMASADVDALFAAGTWPAGLPVNGPTSLGAAMADGLPGGIAITHFDVALKA
jgi:hypothetical protein